MTEHEAGTALQEWKPTKMVVGGAPLPTPVEWDALKDMAAWIHRSHMFPQYKSPEGVMVGLLMVRDMGVAPTLGLAGGFEIQGKIGFETKVKLAALMGRVPTFVWQAEPWDEKVCTVIGRLSSRDPQKGFTYTRAEADSAGYTKTKEGQVKAQWAREPKLMLLYRTLTRWMGLHAPHVLYGLPLALQTDPGDPVEAEFTIIEGKPAGTALGAAGAQGGGATTAEPSAPPPAPAPVTDHKKAFATLCRKMGKTKTQQLLETAGLLMKELGRSAPRSYQEIGPSEWKDIHAQAMKHFDEEGKPRPKADTTPTAAPGAPAVEAPSQPVTGSTEGPKPPADDEEPIFPFDDAAPEAEIVPPSAALEEDRAKWYEQASPEALVEFAMDADKAFAEAGQKRRFLQEHPEGSGDFYFMDGPILTLCGNTKTVGDKRSPVSALLTTKDSEHERFLATEALRIMLSRGIREALDELERSR